MTRKRSCFWDLGVDEVVIVILLMGKGEEGNAGKIGSFFISST